VQRHYILQFGGKTNTFGKEPSLGEIPNYLKHLTFFFVHRPLGENMKRR